MLRPEYMFYVFAAIRLGGVINNALDSYYVLESCNSKLVFIPVGMTSSYLPSRMLHGKRTAGTTCHWKSNFCTTTSAALEKRSHAQKHD